MSSSPESPLQQWVKSSDMGTTRLFVDNRRVVAMVADDVVQRNYEFACSLADYPTQVPEKGFSSLRQIVADDFPAEQAEIEACIAEMLRQNPIPPPAPLPPPPVEKPAAPESGLKKFLKSLFGS